MFDWLLKFGIGGVQEFIGQSRKVRDLAASSDIISEVAYAAAQAAKAAGAAVILPADVAKAHCPHQIVVQLKNTDEDGVRVLAEDMRTLATAKWAAVAKLDGVKQRVGSKHADFDESTLDNQRDTAFPVFWVAVPCDGNYREAFGQVTKAYDDRRLTRTFDQLQPLSKLESWACSVCGARAAVVQPKNQKDWPAGTTFVTKRERLCLVCAAKRDYGMSRLDHVASTYGLSRDRFFRMNVFAGVQAKHSDIDWNELLDNLEDLESLAAKTVDAPEDASDTLAKFLPAFRALRDDKPAWKALDKLSPYYALVTFDGDKMGEWVGGDHFTDEVKADSARFQEAQRAISKALFEFDKSVKAMKEPHRVEVIYAGGDDGLLLCPLDTLLPLIKAVHEAWRVVGDAVHGLAKPDKTPTITLHASVVHAREPLQAALLTMRNLLHIAKEDGGRDCFSILAGPRSGTHVQMIANWKELPSFTTAVSAFSNWRPGDRDIPANLTERNADRLGATLGHAMLDAAPPFLAAKKHDPVPPLLDAFKLELDRMQGRSDKKDCTAWDAVRDWLVDGRARRASDGIGLFSSALQVVLFLARELTWRVES